MTAENGTNMVETTTASAVMSAASRITFSWYDYIFFSLMLAVSALIGVYFGCFGSKQATTKEYLMGGKKMKVIPIAISLAASHISGIMLLAVPADIYRFGATYWLILLPVVVITYITMEVFLPVFFKLQITSSYEYLERRFDSKARSFASFLFALSLFLYLPIVIYIPAMAFSTATGINVHLITPIVCGVCIFYTTIGGLKAVVWTDTLQFTVTIGAVVTVFFLGVKSAGGFGAVWSHAIEGHRLDVFDFDLDPTKRDSFWIVVVGATFGWLSMVSVHQSCVQKYLSVETLREAKLTVVYFSVGISIISSFCVFNGLIMYSKYSDCDPFTTGAVSRNDELLPYFVMDVASVIPGLTGLFIAGIFCAALSTLSASLNCMAGTVYEDFVRKWMSKDVSEATASHILRLIVVVIGVICTGLVFVIEHLGGILPLAISLGGVTSGPLMGMFSLGVLVPRANSRGTLYGAVFSLVFTSYIVIMARYYEVQGLIHYEPKPTSTDGCLFNVTTTNMSSITDSFFANLTTPIPLHGDNSTNYNFLNGTSGDVEREQPFFLFRISYYYYTAIGTLVTMLVGYIISLLVNTDDPPVHRDLLSPVIYFMLPDEKCAKGSTYEYKTVDQALKLVTTDDIDKAKEANGLIM